jgi:hypothetical protein
MKMTVFWDDVSCKLTNTNDGGRVPDASAVTCPREPISFRESVYNVFSYFKREADAVCVCVCVCVCARAPRAFVRVGQYSLVETDQRFRGAYYFHHQVDDSSPIVETTRRNIPEDRHIHLVIIPHISKAKVYQLVTIPVFLVIHA